jgi:hypothetical protein
VLWHYSFIIPRALNITIVLNAHYQEEIFFGKDAHVTLNPLLMFFCGKILHLCELKNVITTPIKELATMILPKKKIKH